MTENFIGLTSNEAEISLKKNGYNEFNLEKKNLILETFKNQFKNPLLILILVVIAISYFLGETIDIAMLTFVAVLNVGIGFFQEYSSNKTLESLQNYIKTRSLVIRDQKKIKVENKMLVPKDLVILTKGDKVPADGKVVKCNNFLVSEAFLTGESAPIIKTHDSDVFAGSYVVSGSAVFEIAKTGNSTRYGELAKDLASIDQDETHIQKLLGDFSKKLIFLSLALILIVLAISLLKGDPFLQSVRTAITLAVTIIPESLVLIITIALTLGAKRILAVKGLVKKLSSVENLGLTSILCIDKTGTITEGKMKVITNEIIEPKAFYSAISLLNEQKTPMEIALYEFYKNNKHSDSEKYTCDQYQEFESKNKFTSGLFTNDNGKKVLFVMGTPIKILDMCHKNLKNIEDIQSKIKFTAKNGEKLIAVAYKENAADMTLENLEWAGFVGVEDNLRLNVKEVLNDLMESGIDIKILTGDNKHTSLKIAQKAGLNIDENDVIDGSEISKFPKEVIYKYTVFANITPQQKFQIVKKLKANGEIITMTGDGINDVLALKKADVAVSMGEASDITKEEADLVLLDNNLMTIKNTIKEGRLVLKNVKNIVAYILSNSFSEITIILLSSLFGLPFPFLISQILWIHMICDGPLDFSLAFERNYSGIMDKEYKKELREEIVNKKTFLFIALVSGFIGLVSFGIFYFYTMIIKDLDLARTMVFIISACSSIYYIYSFKDLRKNISSIKNLFGNSILNVSVVISTILACLPLFIPTLRNVFRISHFHLLQFGLVILIEFMLVVWVEIVKSFVNGYFTEKKTVYSLKVSKNYKENYSN